MANSERNFIEIVELPMRIVKAAVNLHHDLRKTTGC